MTAWGTGDLALHPYFGIVRVTGHKSIDGAMHVAIEPVQVIRKLTVSLVPLSGCLVPLATRDDATRLVALLAEPAASFPPGQSAARLERCARTLMFGEVSRMRQALRQLYSEPFWPSHRDLEVIGLLEKIVIGELAIALDQPYELLRGQVRATSARFAVGAPSAADEATGEVRFELREGQVLAWGGVEAAHSKHVELDARPGWWRSVTNVSGFEDYFGVAVHEESRRSLHHLLLAAKRVETSYTETAMAFVESALDVDDPAHASEHLDPIDATIYGAGVWWPTGDDKLFDVTAVYEGQLAVLIAARRYRA